MRVIMKTYKVISHVKLPYMGTIGSINKRNNSGLFFCVTRQNHLIAESLTLESLQERIKEVIPNCYFD